MHVQINLYCVEHRIMYIEFMFLNQQNDLLILFNSISGQCNRGNRAFRIKNTEGYVSAFIIKYFLNVIHFLFAREMIEV